MDPALLTYLPMDRRHALAEGRLLPERTEGAALFADISGFTPLTEALTQALGARRGAEALSRHLNRVYEALTHQVHQYQGSVITFAGDGITCWFDADGGQRATACALAMQQAMTSFAEVALPTGQIISLTVKVAVAQGPVRRFLVGDPQIQRLEVLAGETLMRLAEAEHLAHRGEVVLDALTARHLGEVLQIGTWREQGETRIAIVESLTPVVRPTPWPALAPERLDEAALRTRLLPRIYERLRAGHGEFLTELRPVAALFVRFSGLDYENDPEVGRKLDEYISAVQRLITRYGGTLIDLSVGDKGSYLYAAFGAPIAYEDDAVRAASAALHLRQPPPESGVLAVQLGLSRGTMRTGAYGGTESRTYGALGDEVNLAARLMQQAAPGQVLASGRIQAATEHRFQWQALDMVRVKGKAELIPLFALLGERAALTIQLQEPTYTLPIVGRAAELAYIETRMELALAGQGQLVGITAEAGMGKSRLVAEVVRRAARRGLVGYGGECQSYGTTIPYLVWQPIWRTLFGLNPTVSLGEQEAALRQGLEVLNPGLLPRLPLLGPVLGLPLSENELTRSFDAKLRKASCEALLVDVLRARAEAAARAGTALLLVLEDVHWLDPLSHDLLEALGHASRTLPLLILLAYRPPDLMRLQVPSITRLPHFSEIQLDALPTPEMAQLIQAKLRQLTHEEGRPVPEGLMQQICARAEGMPFYAEELLHYLHDQGLDPWEEGVLANLELPTSLHRLILSRIDQLSESQKVTLKVASVIGRVFSVGWLLGYYPDLGTPAQVHADLEELRHLDLTPLEQPEPSPTYLFKHIVTQEVAYESLPYERRAALHEQLARYLEGEAVRMLPRSLDLLAYHYERSNNLAKKREYLRRAGEAAQTAYANAAAQAYYERLLPLLESDAEQIEIRLRLGEVQFLVGQWAEAEANNRMALALARQSEDESAVARSQQALGALARQQGKFEEALAWLQQAQAVWAAHGEQQALCRGLAEQGLVLQRQGAFAEAERALTESLRLARVVGDQAGIAFALDYLGNVSFFQGNYPLAWERHNESLVLHQARGDQANTAATLTNLGLVAWRQGNLPLAQHILEEGLALAQKLGNRWNVAMNCYLLGNVAHAQGDFARARALQEEVLALRQELGDRWGLALSLSALGTLAYTEGALAEARHHFEDALALCRALGDRRGIALALSLLGLALHEQGELASALALQQESVTLALAIGSKSRLLSALIGMAAVLAALPPPATSQAARLLASANQMRTVMGERLDPAPQRAYDRTLDTLQSVLDEDTLAAAWSEGQAMTLEELLAEIRV